MLKKPFVLVLVVAFALLALAACKPKSPTAPSNNEVCQDPKANNLGSPLPCTYTVPAESFVRLTRTIPSAGSTLKANSCPINVSCGCPGPDCSLVGDRVYAYVEWAISQTDRDEAVRRGKDIFVEACLSVDGVTVVGRKKPTDGGGSCFIRRVPAEAVYGETEHQFTVSKILSPDVTQTNYVLLFMGRLEQLPSAMGREYFKGEAVSAVFYWQ